MCVAQCDKHVHSVRGGATQGLRCNDEEDKCNGTLAVTLSITHGAITLTQTGDPYTSITHYNGADLFAKCYCNVMLLDLKIMC